MSRIILGLMCLFLLGLSPNGHSQSYASFKVVKDTLTPGDPLVAYLNAVLPPTGNVTLDFSTLQEIPNLVYKQDTTYFSKYADFKILNGGKMGLKENNLIISSSSLDLQPGPSGRISRDCITIALFDVGVFSIPSPLLRGISSPLMNTQPPIVTVVLPQSVQQALQDSIKAAPIKPILEEPMTIEDFKLLFISLGIFLACIALFYFFRSRKKEVEEEVEEEIIIPAHVTALEKLDTLNGQELWQSGKIKEYQSELTYIIREYLENRFHFNALEMTTGEIMKDLPEVVDKDKLSQILQMADLVKFAKANPPENIHSRFMDMAYDLVKETKEEEEKAELDD